jgi:hypothetical protein
MTVRARMWREKSGADFGFLLVCLLLACDGATTRPLVSPGGGGSTPGRAGEGGARAAGVTGAGAASAGSANASGNAPGFGPGDGPRIEGGALDGDGHGTALGGTGSGGAGSGGQGFGGGQSGRGGGAGTAGSGAGTEDGDDDDDGPGSDGQRRYADVQSDAIWRARADCLGAPICHATRADRARAER